MNKYKDYLDQMIGELEWKERGIEKSNQPIKQINLMRELYSKMERTNNYFSHYRDKGTGRENYQNYLKAQKQYEWKYNPEKRQEKIKYFFERTINNAPRGGRKGRDIGHKGGYSYWTSEDWGIYEQYINASFDYSFQGWLEQRW